MNETLAADLSNIALRLLVAVWMAGGTHVVLSRRELEIRAGLSHNSLDLARSQLQAHGLLTVERTGDGKSNAYTLHVTQTPPAPMPVESVSELQEAFRRLFPREAKQYPLTPDNARRLLKLGTAKRILELFEEVSHKPSVKYPKAYVEKILREKQEETEEPEEVPPEVLRLVKKGQRRHELFT